MAVYYFFMSMVEESTLQRESRTVENYRTFFRKLMEELRWKEETVH